MLAPSFFAGTIIDSGATKVRFADGLLHVDSLRLQQPGLFTSGRGSLGWHRPDHGTLKVGSVGDATVIDLTSGKFDYSDSIGERLVGDKRLLSAGVVLAGKWWHPT